MTFSKIEEQKTITNVYNKTNSKRVVQDPAVHLLSFKNAQTGAGLSVECSTKSKQQYIQSYVRVKSKDGKMYNFNKTLEKRINNVTAKIQKAEKENGLIGNAWSWTKNAIGFGDSSDKVREIQANERNLLVQFNGNVQARASVFTQLTGCEYTEENLEKFIQGQIKLKSEIAIEKYKEGQDMAVEITSDIVSGVVSYGTAATCIAAGVAAAPFTAGASLGAVALGVGIAATAGAVTKVAIKGAESLVAGKTYSFKQAGKDAAIGALSGGLAPVTMGTGGAVTNLVGKVAPKFVSTVARFSTEGAIFGAVDGAARSALDGASIDQIGSNTLKGAGAGALAGNILGHGGNLIGKGAKNIYDNLTPVCKGNGFSYKISPLGKKYKLQLDKPTLEQIKFDLKISRSVNPHPTNLTNELERNHYGKAGVEKLLRENPNLSPIVGSLPQKWGKFLAGKQGLEQVDGIFYNISKKYTHNLLRSEDLLTAQKQLSDLLGMTVKIEALDSGQVGQAFVVTVNEQKFVLKCFHHYILHSLDHHGNYAELSNAVFASRNDKGHFARFYMGRFGENNDGYILTKFVEYKPNNHNYRLSNFIKSMSSDDLGHNVHGNVVIDYGGAWSDHVLTKFNYNERKILREMVNAIDNNNLDEVNSIITKYASSNNFINPVKYLKAIIHNTTFRYTGVVRNRPSFAADYLIDRAQCLQRLNIDCIPSLNNAKERIVPTTIDDFGYLWRKSEPDHFVGEKYYGLNFKEWSQLFNKK